VARRPGSDNLAGSTITMPRLRQLVEQQLGLNPVAIAQLIEQNPAAALRPQ
jgi:N-acetylglucosamine-6-phosphate deacetylase